MKLNLLKEAQLASNMTEQEHAMLKTAAIALGKQTAVELLESFRPTRDDYTKWLSTIVGHAADNKININRRTNFDAIAYDMFENDPTPPPYEMEQMIVKKLWSDYQAARHGTRIDQVAQAQEDEEELDKAARDFEQNGEFSGSTEDDSLELDDSGEFDDVGGADDSELGDDTEEDPYLVYQQNGGTLSREAFDDDTAELDDEEFEQYIKCGNADSCDDSGVDDDLDIDPQGEEDLDFDDIDPEVSAIADRVMHPSREPRISNEEEEVPVAQKSSSPSAKTNFLKSMLSSPRTNISSALKDVADDAANAWKAHELPTNPHPKNSMAYKAWERGLTKAVQDHFGLAKASLVTSKGKAKKR